MGRRLSRAYLASAVNYVLVTGQLFGTDRSARMDPSGGDTDFSPHTEFTAIGELRRRIVQQNCTVKLMEELLRGTLILSNDCFGMPGTIADNMLDRLINTYDRAD